MPSPISAGALQGIAYHAHLLTISGSCSTQIYVRNMYVTGILLLLGFSYLMGLFQMDNGVSIKLELGVQSVGVLGLDTRPVVIWHGLGDNYNASGIHKMMEIIDQLHPQTQVYSIRLNEDPNQDERQSLVGDMNKKLDQVCEEISTIPYLSQGFDAIGNSQGGLFLRGLQERCDFVKVHNLITFGSPHMGVMDLPICSDPKDWVCKRRNDILKKQVWYGSVQHTVVPAQYFRDPRDYENYMKYSNLLADLNNESLDSYNVKYANKIRMLNKFVMVKFLDDTTVVPKTSAHFSDIDPTGEVIGFRDTLLYKADMLGLRTLDLRGGVVFYELEGRHMNIPEPFFADIVLDYLGGRI